MKQGIFLISFGSRGYHYAAYNLAFSIKFYNPNIKIAVLHDDAFLRWLSEDQRKIFDILIPVGSTSDPAAVKISMYDHLPFEENIYLDVDAIALQDVSSIFDELRGGEYYYTHVFDTHKISQGREIPSMIWAWADDIWSKYNLSQDAVLPCTNSSFQYIRKCDQAKALFDQIKENYANPIPLTQLRNRWGGGQPDELYLNIALAQKGLLAKTDKQYMFLANVTQPEKPHELQQIYYIMSMFGGKEFVRPKYKQWYDDMLIKMFRTVGKNHLYKFNNYIASDKIANKKGAITQRATSVKPVTETTATKTKKKLAEKINLFISFYVDDKIQRRQEITDCINKNIACSEVNNIFLVTESCFPNPFTNEKVKYIQLDHRPTYSDLFQIANDNNDQNTYSIIQNADIYHDEANLKLIKDIYFNNLCLALSRWDVSGSAIRHLNYEHSQDCWIFKGKIKSGIDGNFPLGKPGCDNRIAFELAKQYTITNPSKTIRTYHLHSGGNTWGEADRIHGDYLPLKPCIADFKKRLLIIQPGKVGDIIICLPIAKHFSDEFNVEWLCPKQYHNIFNSIDYATAIENQAGNYDKVIDLSFGLSNSQVNNWWIKNRDSYSSFVLAKYQLAGVDVKEKNKLAWNRNELKEDELLVDLIKDHNYALVHDASDHGTPPLIETSLPIIYFKPHKDFTIFDWYKVIQGAKEIHCIDSSLLNFVDVIKTEAKKYYYKTDRAANKWNETIVSDKWVVKDQLQLA